MNVNRLIDEYFDYLCSKDSKESGKVGWLRFYKETLFAYDIPIATLINNTLLVCHEIQVSKSIHITPILLLSHALMTHKISERIKTVRVFTLEQPIIENNLHAMVNYMRDLLKEAVSRISINVTERSYLYENYWLAAKEFKDFCEVMGVDYEFEKIKPESLLDEEEFSKFVMDYLNGYGIGNT